MIYKILLLSIHLLGLLNSPQIEHSEDEQRVYYFSTLAFVETPLSPFKGSIPLSAEIASRRKHFRFSYDSLDRLTSLSFYTGDFPSQPNHTANLFFLSHRLEFQYEEDREIISFYDSNGTPTSVLGNCHRFIYQLNELGYRAALYFEDKEGKRIENSWNIFQYTWNYQADGSVIEERFNQKKEAVSIRPGFEFYRLRLYFNPLGHIALMQNIDQEGKLIENSTGAAQDQIKTNAAGNFIAWQVLDKEGQPEKGNGPDVAMGIQSFNEFGYEISLEHRDEKGQRICSKYGICISRTEFDSWGNLKERKFYDTEGRAAQHQIAAYHHLKIVWDKSGRFRESLSYFDTEGRAVSHHRRGYASVSYTYDDEKRLKQISYLNTKGDLVNRKDNGVAFIRYEYNEKGAEVSSIRYNKSEQIITN